MKFKQQLSKIASPGRVSGIERKLLHVLADNTAQFKHGNLRLSCKHAL